MKIDSWEKEYYELASKYDEDNSDWKVKKALDYLISNLKPGERILEVGCGTANFADKLSQKIFYTGVDISDYALEEAERRLGGKNIRSFVKADADRLPFKDEEFEAVLAKFSLEHFPAPKESLLEMIRVLKVGGSLIIISPNLEFPFCFPAAYRHKGFLFRIKLYFLRLYDYIMRLLGRYNFRVLKDNYLSATGRYEKKDDDLVYLVSSFEVINFLKKLKFGFIFINELKKPFNGFRQKIRKLIDYLPGMKYYGIELFIIAKKNAKL